jgi:hypothetical protein
MVSSSLFSVDCGNDNVYLLRHTSNRHLQMRELRLVVSVQQ